MSDNSESEEEDEADEDSNGLCCDLDRGVVLMFLYEPSQPRSTIRTTIPMRNIRTAMMVVCNICIEYQLI